MGSHHVSHAPKLTEVSSSSYPILASKSGRIQPPAGPPGPRGPGPCAVSRSVTSYGNFRLTFVDALPGCAHIGQTYGVDSRQVLGGFDMGAAPDRTGHLTAFGSLPNVDSRKELNSTTSSKPGPQRFARVPTHVIGVARERRSSPRALLALPLRLTRVGNYTEPVPVTLVTRNISSSGVYFLAPRHFEPGTAIELEVALVERPLGMGTVQMCTAAHIVRAEESDMPGWCGYAATFDDFALSRDDVLPLRYRTR